MPLAISITDVTTADIRDVSFTVGGIESDTTIRVVVEGVYDSSIIGNAIALVGTDPVFVYNFTVETVTTSRTDTIITGRANSTLASLINTIKTTLGTTLTALIERDAGETAGVWDIRANLGVYDDNGQRLRDSITSLILNENSVSGVIVNLNSALLAWDPIRGQLTTSYPTPTELENTLTITDAEVLERSDIALTQNVSQTPTEWVSRYSAKYSSDGVEQIYAPLNTPETDRVLLPTVYPNLVYAVDAVGVRAINDYMEAARVDLTVNYDPRIAPRAIVTALGSTWQVVTATHDFVGSRGTTRATLRLAYNPTEFDIYTALVAIAQPKALANLRLGAVTGSIIQLLWDYADVGSQPDGVLVTVTTAAGSLGTHQYLGTGTLVAFATIANTRYTFSIRTFNYMGESAASEIMATTERTVTASPGGASVSNLELLYRVKETGSQRAVDEMVANSVSYEATVGHTTITVEPETVFASFTDSNQIGFKPFFSAAEGAGVSTLIYSGLYRALALNCSTVCSSVAAQAAFRATEFAFYGSKGAAAVGYAAPTGIRLLVGTGLEFIEHRLTFLSFALAGRQIAGGGIFNLIARLGLGAIARVAPLINIATLPITYFQITSFFRADEVARAKRERSVMVTFQAEGNGYPIVGRGLAIRTRTFNRFSGQPTSAWGSWSPVTINSEGQGGSPATNSIPEFSIEQRLEVGVSRYLIDTGLDVDARQFQLAMRVQVRTPQGDFWSGQGDPSSPTSVSNLPSSGASDNGFDGGGWTVSPAFSQLL